MVGTAGFEQVKDNATDWKTLAEKRRFGIEILSNQPTFNGDAVHAYFYLQGYGFNVIFLGDYDSCVGYVFFNKVFEPIHLSWFTMHRDRYTWFEVYGEF